MSKGTAGEVIGITNQIIVYDETGKEIILFRRENSGGDYGDYSGNQGFPRDLYRRSWVSPRESLSQETIMGIMASVPDETLQNHGFPPGNCYTPVNTRILSLSFTESDQT